MKNLVTLVCVLALLIFSAARASAQQITAGFTKWDVAAIKNFRIRESKTLQFRAEFFNIFNQTNCRLPNNDINSPNFGKIQGALDPGLIQLALKFLF
jgi:hypothetical protein